jgi:hypothetical protein
MSANSVVKTPEVYGVAPFHWRQQGDLLIVCVQIKVSDRTAVWVIEFYCVDALVCANN